MTALAALVLATVGTYLVRAGSVRIFAARSVPERLDRALRCSAIAVMASLVASSVLEASDGSGPPLPACAAVAAAAVAARARAGTSVVLGVGVAVGWAATLVVP